MKSFKTEKGLKNHFSKYGCLDSFKFKGIIYTQEEYDFKGEVIAYKNKRTTNHINIITLNNRYKEGFKNCEIEFIENLGSYRLGINYID